MKPDMKSKFCTLAASALLLVGVVSCDYLDVAPPETVDRDDILKTQVDALEYLYSCYGPIQNATLIQNFRPYNLRQGSDEWVALSPQNCDAQRYQWNQPTGMNTYYGAFQEYYNSIGYCNMFIRDINEKVVPGLSDELKAQYIAEAQFLKAYLHCEAMIYYGPIPITDEVIPTNVATDAMPGRSHFDYCADYVANLCDIAYENLPSVYSVQQYYGRATRAAAKFLKARVRWLAASPLFNGEFPNKSWANENYETPGYGTELISHTYDASKWEVARQACLEAIQEAEAAGHVLFDVDGSEARRLANDIPLPQIPGVDTSTPEGEEFAKRVMLMRYVVTTGPDQGNNEAIWGMLYIAPDMDNSCVPHYVITDQNSVLRGAWGWISPSLHAVESFYTADGRQPAEDPDFTPESRWFESSGIRLRDDDGRDTPEVINLCVGREPRFYAWIGFDGGEYSPVIKNGSNLILRMRDSNENGYNPNFGANNQSQTGFYNIKMVHPNLRYTGIDANNNMSEGYNHTWALFRLADLYLMLAECDARLNQHLDEGVSYLNRVRERAGVPAVEQSDVSGSGQLLEVVLDEISNEFYFEVRRQLEIRRNVIGPETMSKSHYRGLNAVVSNPSFEEFNTPMVIEQPFEWDDRMYLYPIHNEEIYSDPQLIQAPGY